LIVVFSRLDLGGRRRGAPVYSPVETITDSI
jgi:hypothetical protein